VQARPNPSLVEALFLSAPSIIDCFFRHGFLLGVRDRSIPTQERSDVPEGRMNASSVTAVLCHSDSAAQALASLMLRAAHDTPDMQSWWHANLRALLQAGLSPSWALRFVRAYDVRTLDLLLAHGADIGVLLLPQPEGCRRWGSSLRLPHIEVWLRALHERGLDFREVDFAALCDDRLGLWSSLRPTKETVALAWQVITDLESESRAAAARAKQEQHGLTPTAASTDAP
jgi:hypothetical protein